MVEYEPPWEYSFPPFFTLQHHEETKKRQLALWADIILKYSKAAKKNRLNMSNCSIFSNEEIGRTMSSDLVSEVFASLQQNGYIYPADKAENEWNVCWRSVEEYADMMYNWASETGQVNAVCTLYEVSAANPEFSDINEDILMKALRKLEERGKCEVFDIDGSYGVKFF